MRGSDTKKEKHTEVNFIFTLGGSDSKEPACNAGDLSSIPGSGRSPGGGHGNPLQYSYLENSMDRGAWWATVYGVTKSRTRLSDTLSFTFPFEDIWQLLWQDRLQKVVEKTQKVAVLSSAELTEFGPDSGT